MVLAIILIVLITKLQLLDDLIREKEITDFDR